MRKRLRTDRQLLRAIYDEYLDTFSAFSKENPDRNAIMYVPVDLNKIAKKFSVNPHLVFGRLYYHLNKKHGYKREDDKTEVPLFTLGTVKDGHIDRHCVNFPLLEGVLADLEFENRKFTWAISIAVFSLFVSVTSFVIANHNAVWTGVKILMSKIFH